MEQEFTRKNQKAPSILDYVDLVQFWRIIPNFWTAAEYMKVANWKIKTDSKHKWIWPVDETGDTMLPALPYQKENDPPPEEGRFHWAGWPGEIPSSDSHGGWTQTEVDKQYEFRPSDFDRMEGGQWAVFRKNCRKWPNRNKADSFSYTRFPVPSFQEIERVLEEWSISTGVSKELYDPEVMLSFLVEGTARRFLRKGGRLIGINCWDSNWFFVNFRYCVCAPGEPFLSEFMRWLFFQDPNVRKTSLQVNDGGVLGKEALKIFKDKMNPTRIQTIYGWEKKE